MFPTLTVHSIYLLLWYDMRLDVKKPLCVIPNSKLNVDFNEDD